MLTITTDIPDILWLDEIPEIRCTSSGSTEINVTAQVGNLSSFFDSRLYITNKDAGVGVYLRALAEEVFQLKGFSCSTITVKFSAADGATAERTFGVVYRTRATLMDCATFATRRFLTMADALTIPRGGSIELSWLSAPQTEEQFSLELIALTPEGETLRIPGPTDKKIENDTTLFLQHSREIAYNPADYSPGPTEGGYTPKGLVASVGNRSINIYFVDNITDVFRYDNAFGCVENFYCAGSLTSKTTTSGSLGRVRSTLLRYDVQETQELTYNFGPTMPKDVMRISEISSAVSPYWGQWKNGEEPEMHPIVVESAEWDYDEDPDELAKPELTFRLTHILTLDPTIGKENRLNRLHSQEFSEEFN